MHHKLQGLMETYGEYFIDYLKERQKKLSERNLKGENEFETLWMVAETEGRKRELLDLIKDLEKIWKAPIK